MTINITITAIDADDLRNQLAALFQPQSKLVHPQPNGPEPTGVSIPRTVPFSDTTTTFMPTPEPEPEPEPEPAPVKTRKSRTASAKPAPVPTPAPSASPPISRDVIRRVLTEYLAQNDNEKTMELLQRYGHTDRLSTLDEQYFEAVYAAATADAQ